MQIGPDGDVVVATSRRQPALHAAAEPAPGHAASGSSSAAAMLPTTRLQHRTGGATLARSTLRPGTASAGTMLLGRVWPGTKRRTQPRAYAQTLQRTRSQIQGQVLRSGEPHTASCSDEVRSAALCLRRLWHAWHEPQVSDARRTACRRCKVAR